MISTQFTIAEVSEQTGIAKEVLRKWETRYGFPVPERNGADVRRYPAGQVERIQLIKTLLEDGMRPGQVVPLEYAQLRMLLANRCPALAHPLESDFTDGIVTCLQAHDPRLLRSSLQSELAQRGLREFILDIMPALNDAVGNAWANGAISVKDEHVYTEAMQALLRQDFSVPAGLPGAPRILLTTPPQELHTLGILMVDAILSLEGAICISLGSQTPLLEIASASVAYQADIIGVSFSASFPRKKILPFLRELRSLCPAEIEIWAGGSGGARMETIPRGISLVPTLRDALAMLHRHQRRQLVKRGELLKKT